MALPSSTTTPNVIADPQPEPASPSVVPAQTWEIPFDGVKKEFIDDLDCVSVDLGATKVGEQAGEKQTRMILQAKPGRKRYLPGQPRIRLDKRPHNADPNTDYLLEYLDKCHNTRGLDDLLPCMRYIMVQTPSHAHIMPLHHQKSHAREIKVTENPGLHLVWYYELIFIKPIPAYFYSVAFWEYIENADPELRKACLGFMRSYDMLIQYEMDFREACELHLIPAKGDGDLPTYEEWCEFIEPFAKVGDDFINLRYHYGELRLTRINRAAVLFKFNLAYFHIYPQWGSFLEHALAPIITVFAVCSVVLNSMQVSLAAVVIPAGTVANGWPAFVGASLWFPVVVIIAIAVVLAVALFGMGIMGIIDWRRASLVRKRKKKGDMNAGTRTHGIVW